MQKFKKKRIIFLPTCGHVLNLFICGTLCTVNYYVMLVAWTNE